MKQIKTIQFPQDTEPREIVDAQARADIEYLKNNTTVKETDPTVPSWAKEPTKPSYTADEIGAAQAEHYHDDTYALKSEATTQVNYDGNGNVVLTNVAVDTDAFTETDPTVPEWAKQPNKPTYTADEVGALPNTTVIPSVDGLATETYVDNKVASLVDSAPETLNTLNELATALGDDPNFATTIVTQLGNKAEKNHSHQTVDILDFPESMPASDVYDWAKQENPPIVPTEEVVDSTVAYVKDVPADAASYAEVVEIGGMTRKWNQLLQLKAPFSSTVNGVTLTVNDNGSITLNGQATSRASLGIISSLNIPVVSGHKYYMECGSTTFHVNWALSSEEPGDLKIATATQTLNASVQVDIFETTTVFNNKTFFPKIVDLTEIYGAGNEPTTAEECNITRDHEPYDAGSLRSAPVTKVESVGANLFDVTKATIYSRIRTNNGTVEMLTSSSDQASSDFIFVSPNTKYVLNFSYYSTGDYGMAFYDSNKGYISGTKQSSIETSDLNTPFVFTTSNNCYYIRFSVGGGKYYNDVSLNKGDTTFPYTPYVRNTLPVPEAVQALDGYGWGVSESVYNYIDWEKKRFVKRVGCVDFGALNWTQASESKVWGTTNLRGLCVPNVGMTDKYTVVGIIDAFSQADKTIQIRDDVIYLKDLSISAQTEIVGMLYYELATPIITDISDLLLANNLISVEDGGTVTMVNEYGYDVPNTLRFCTGNNEIIGANTLVGDLNGTAARAKMAETDALGKVIHESYAPAGYGLGGASKDISGVDLNTVTANGWYQFAAAGENCPVGGYSYMFVASRNEDHVTQTVYASNNTKLAGITMKRARLSGVWYPWEYENPYMELGVEYRTTERWQGKPVYVKMVDCGEMPSAGTHKNIEVTSGLPDTHKIVGMECVFESEHYGEYLLKRYCVNYCTETNNSGEIKGIAWAYSTYSGINVTIKALGDITNYSAVATVKYVK